MVPRGGETFGHPSKDGLTLVTDFGNFAMHEPVCPHDIATEDMPNTLMAEADSKSGNARSKFFDHSTTDARLLWRAGTGGNADMIRLLFGDLIESDLIIPVNLHLRTHLSEVLDEVVGKGVVVVDDQEHGEWSR